MSKTRFWIAIAAVLVLAAAIFGAGYLIYQTRGEIISAIGEVNFEEAPDGYYYYHMRPKMHFMPFSFGGIFITFLFFLIIFGFIKRLFFPRRYWYGPHMRGWKGHPKHMGWWGYDEDEDAGEVDEKEKA